MQVTSLVPPTVVNTNAAKSTIYGAEIESELLVTDRLRFSAGVSLLDTEFDEFPNGPVYTPNPLTGGSTVSGADLSGNELARSPDWTANVAATYTHPTPIGDLETTLSYFHSARFSWEPNNRFQQEAYDVLNGEIAVTSRDGRYRVSAWAKNLLDEEYAI
jgi:iron complex outermembrane receptor protein